MKAGIAIARNTYFEDEVNTPTQASEQLAAGEPGETLPRLWLAALQTTLIELPRLQRAPAAAKMAAECLVQAMSADCAVVALLTEHDVLKVLHSAGCKRTEARTTQALKAAPQVAMAEAALFGRLVLLARDEERLLRYPATAEDGPPRGAAWAAVPLCGDGSPYGAIGLTFESEHAFSNGEGRFLEAFGRAAGYGLERLPRKGMRLPAPLKRRTPSQLKLTAGSLPAGREASR